MRVLTQALVILLGLTVAYSVVKGAEPIKEMSMYTEVGEIVLTVEPCPIQNAHGFDYYGYATDAGNPNHPGCWNADNAVVQIWFLNENVVGIYKKELFKPRMTV